MGFDNQLMELEYPCALDPAKGRPWAVPISSGTNDFVLVCTLHECITLSLLSFSLVQSMQPTNSAPKLRDNVMVTCDCGYVITILYSRLAMRLWSVAIIIHIHLYLILLESTFETIYHNSHLYAYKAKCWCSCPYKSTVHSSTGNGNWMESRSVTLQEPLGEKGGVRICCIFYRVTKEEHLTSCQQVELLGNWETDRHKFEEI